MTWINTKERMPKPNEIVVFLYNEEAHIGYFIEKSEYHSGMLWQSHIDSYNCVQDVTWWMPLLNPPEDYVD